MEARGDHTRPGRRGLAPRGAARGHRGPRRRRPPAIANNAHGHRTAVEPYQPSIGKAPEEVLAVVDLHEGEHEVDGLYVKEVSPRPDGAAGALLAVPGAFHGAWAFERWLPVLAAGGWRSFSMSLRGHTGSYTLRDQEWTSLRVEDYAADVRRVQRWIGAPVVLLGHSMGGIVAQRAAEAGDVAGLVLLCAVGPGQLGAMRGPVPAERPLHMERAAARAAWFYDVGEDTFDSVYRRLGPESPTVRNEYSSGALRIDAARVRCPVLAIGAERDGTPVPRAERIAAFYGGEAVVVPGAGHDLMFEDRGQGVAQLIVRWLARSVALRSPLEGLLTRPGAARA